MSIRSPIQQQRRSCLIFLLFILSALLLVGAVAFAVSSYYIKGSAGSMPTPIDIGITIAPDGEHIGISDGSYAFDTNRNDGNLKRQAADEFKKRDITGAESLWKQAASNDTSDAEVLIYQEDQRVLIARRPYITVVVGTILTGTLLSTGRDNLQGAYVAQKEYNDQCLNLPDCIPVRLLIANSGSGSTASDEVGYASFVMEQIVRARQFDKTIVGVVGWPASSNLVYVTTVLGSAQIPIVSPTASVIASTESSPYFFSVAPSNMRQGSVGALYAERTLRARRVALFVDPVDRYSETLADAFRQQFTADGNTIVALEDYKVGDPESVIGGLAGSLSQKPDLIYFAGHSNDVGALLTNLPDCRPSTCLQVLGGDALYELGGYPPNVRDQLHRLHFTSFAYPDEWSILAPSAHEPQFFSDYPQAFNPSGANHASSPYGYIRADNDVILSYDAMQALLIASNATFNDRMQSFSPNDLQQALQHLTGSQAIQGVSGQISFGPDGNPINKVVAILYFDSNDYIHFDQSFGCFLKPLTTSAIASCS